ncbi:MAG: NFACT RNA binding domain-containing protein [Eubacteriales bacterium]|nr:NFACT RNA binding domain-containing protein [Eubacteriales bacterium]
MAFDGITIAAMVRELHQNLDGGRFNKIAQPEADALMITGKGANGQCRLLLSASASLPLIYFTDKNKPSPLTAPNFCMLLRKHIGSARISSIRQPGLERVVEFELEHRNEMGDPCRKFLIAELMGKHSNIIFCDENRMILDSIKHVSSHMSSVREVLPGRDYFLPHTQEKFDPLTITETEFIRTICTKPCNISKAIYSTLTGLSPLIAEEICYRASIDGSDAAQSLNETAATHLYHTFHRLMEQVTEGDFTPNIIYRDNEPVEYSVLPLTQYGNEYHSETFSTVSSMLETYYASRDTLNRIRQKSSDLRRIVQTALDRNRKKYALQQKQMKDTAKKDKYKVYGELINTYGYGLEDGCKSFKALNYYTNEEITIPLDPTLTPQENSKKYFDRYGKLKRTEEALTEQLADTESEIEHLESISNALDIARAESDLSQIKEELTEYGYIKKHYSGKKGAKAQIKSKPFHYISSDGFDIFVGKNNFQNDELTFKQATGNDWWFHAKKMAGSHVIVKTPDGELPDRTFEEAGRLAAYYSKGRTAPKVEIDYIQKKHVKKPGGAKPGFVVYYTNYSLMAEPDISGLKEASDGK